MPKPPEGEQYPAVAATRWNHHIRGPVVSYGVSHDVLPPYYRSPLLSTHLVRIVGIVVTLLFGPEPNDGRKVMI